MRRLRSRNWLSLTAALAGACLLTSACGGGGGSGFPARFKTSWLRVPFASVKAVTTSGQQTCVLLGEGSVKCWKGLTLGAAKSASTKSRRATRVSSGGGYGGTSSCAVIAAGRVECWGAASYGRLGNGSRSGRFADPVAVKGVNDAISVSVGGAHACALIRDGTIDCWGWGYFGQLGNGVIGQLGNGVMKASLVPVQVSGISDAVQVSAGTFETCALLRGGTVSCWGANSNPGGERNTGFAIGVPEGWFQYGYPTPVPVKGISGAVALSTGANGSCVVLSSGKVKCWGASVIGPRSDGNYGYTCMTGAPSSNSFWQQCHAIPAWKPVTIEGVVDASGVSVGGDHSCASLEDGSVECWGFDSGQLGAGPVSNCAVNATSKDGCFQLRPTVCLRADNSCSSSGEQLPRLVRVRAMRDAVSVSAGGSASCALRRNGRVECWTGAEQS